MKIEEMENKIKEIRAKENKIREKLVELKKENTNISLVDFFHPAASFFFKITKIDDAYDKALTLEGVSITGVYTSSLEIRNNDLYSAKICDLEDERNFATEADLEEFMCKAKESINEILKQNGLNVCL